MSAATQVANRHSETKRRRLPVPVEKFGCFKTVETLRRGFV
jgi:hypothetical protein